MADEKESFLSYCTYYAQEKKQFCNTKRLYLWLMILTVCPISSAFAQQAKSIPSTPNEEYYLSTEQLDQLKKNAFSGDGNAANRVAQYFFYSEDVKLINYWWLIGAQNGNSSDQDNYATVLMQNSDTDSQVRALFWLEKSADNVSKNTITQLQGKIKQQKEVLSAVDFSFGDACPESICDIVRKYDNSQKTEQELILRKLSFENILALRISSLCGNYQAANLLIVYYQSIGSLLQRNYFVQIAAEDGDPLAQLNFGIITFYQSVNDESRGLYWVKRSYLSSNQLRIKKMAMAFIKNHT